MLTYNYHKRTIPFDDLDVLIKLINNKEINKIRWLYL